MRASALTLSHAGLVRCMCPNQSSAARPSMRLAHPSCAIVLSMPHKQPQVAVLAKDS